MSLGWCFGCGLGCFCLGLCLGGIDVFVDLGWGGWWFGGFWLVFVGWFLWVGCGLIFDGFCCIG